MLNQKEVLASHFTLAFNLRLQNEMKTQAKKKIRFQVLNRKVSGLDDLRRMKKSFCF